MTQEAVGAKLHWSREKVAQYIQVLDKVVTENLDLAKKHQEGRVTEDITIVTFTEGWFRELLKDETDRR